MRRLRRCFFLLLLDGGSLALSVVGACEENDSVEVRVRVPVDAEEELILLASSSGDDEEVAKEEDDDSSS